MTIPTLVNSYQEKATIVKLKKQYALLSEALKMEMIDNGPVTEWGLTTDNSQEGIEVIRTFLKRQLQLM